MDPEAAFNSELDKLGMVVPDGYAAEALRAAGINDELSARRFARDLVFQRSAEKPGADLLGDPDTVNLADQDLAQLVWALAEAGRAGQGEDPLLSHVRLMALGEIANLAGALRERGGDGWCSVPRAGLLRVASALHAAADVIDSDVDLLADLLPLREQIVRQVRADADRSQDWASR